MSTSKRKGRLALKKKTGPAVTTEANSSTQTTILSMFKKQRNRDDKSEAKVTEQESGADGDVIITGVTHETDEGTSKNATDVLEESKLKRTVSNNFSASKKKGRLSMHEKADHASGKTTEMPEEQPANQSVSINFTASKKKARLSLVKKNKEESIAGDTICISDDRDKKVLSDKQRMRKSESLDCPTPYKLRKRKTVPVIEIASESDSDDDTGGENRLKQNLGSENLVIDIPSSGSSDFQEKSTGRKRKVSLKKSKTADDINVKPERKRTRNQPDHNKDTHRDRSEGMGECDADSLEKMKFKTNQNTRGNSSTEQNPKEKNCDPSPGGKRPVSSPERGKSNFNTQVSSRPAEKGGKSEKKEGSISEEKHRLTQSNRSFRKSLAIESNSADLQSGMSDPHTKELKQSTIHQLFKRKSTDGLSAKVGTDLSDEVNKEGKSKEDEDDYHTNDTAAVKAKPKLKNESSDVIDVNTVGEESQTTENEDADEKTEALYRVPYYLENFRTILDSTLADKENVRLFNEIDMAYISAFNQLTEPCQKLYVRLFSRKLAWLPMSRLKYPEISSDVPQLVDELHSAGLLHLGDRLDDLKIVLKILAAPDLKMLAKSFHIINTGTKEKIIELLLKKSQQSSIATMFTGGAGLSTEKTMLNRALSYLGKVCRLEETARAVFIRLLMLFSLYHTNFDEESAMGGGQNQLFQMLMANIGRVVYPSYTIDRQTPVFQDRTALVRFETALQFELDVQVEIEKSRWVRAHEVYAQARAAGASLKKDKHILKWDSALPVFLRLYTACSVYVRIGSLGVEILQRQKRYHEAVDLLEELLAQDLYCIHHRGHWYERLALNLDAHLKAQQKSLEVVIRGLSEKRVHTGRRLALYERAKKICEAPKSKFADKLSEIDHEPVLPTPEVSIEGMVISDATSMGMKYQFVMSGNTDQVTLCAVEELVLEHYKTNGYPDGLHAEGSIVSNLFVLFFWDVLFMAVPDVFHGPFQTAPLDLHTRDFYRNRKPAIEERLEWLQQAGEEELVSAVGEIWEKHSGEMCQGINWEKFAGPETHQGLVRCMGGKVIAGMLERFVKNPRHTRSGFPDLTLWNTETKTLKICEVKGPNDRLSYKQILWIDYLLKLGVDAEVCYVKAVGSKKLKPSTSNS